MTRALGRLTQLAATWHKEEAGDAVREAAVRLLRVTSCVPPMR